MTSAVQKASQALNERGERLGRAEEKTEDLKNSAQQFAETAHKVGLSAQRGAQLWVVRELRGPELFHQYVCHAAAKSLQPSPTLCSPRDSSPPGSSVHGTLQARVLEWVAVSFSQVCHDEVQNRAFFIFFFPPVYSFLLLLHKLCVQWKRSSFTCLVISFPLASSLTDPISLGIVDIFSTYLEV